MVVTVEVVVVEGQGGMVMGGGWQPSQVDLQTGSSNPSQPTAVLARLTDR